MKKAVAKAKIERLSAEIEYKCPECGAYWAYGIDFDDVRDLLDGSLEVKCSKCGAKLEIGAQ